MWGIPDTLQEHFERLVGNIACEMSQVLAESLTGMIGVNPCFPDCLMNAGVVTFQYALENACAAYTSK